MAVNGAGGSAAADPVVGLVAALQAAVAACEAATAAALAAVPTSRTITAGTGLTGGGDLSANRSLSVSYGTAAGTACQGNDARLSDQRTPADGSVTTAKLAAGLVIDGGTP